MERREHVYRDPKALKPWPRNPRTHTEQQILQLRASIQEWGFTNPLLIEENNFILAGHGRQKASLAEQLVEVPCILMLGLTEVQKDALNVADNKLALLAAWDEDMLADVMRDLVAAGYDTALTGFGDEEMARMLDSNKGSGDPDDVPQTPLKPVSRLGDTWVLGRHRLRCGSSVDKDDVAQLLGAVRPMLMVTDPPYGVDYDPGWRAKARNADGSRLSTGNDRALGVVTNDAEADWTEAWRLFPGDVAYVWHAGVHAGEVHDSLVRGEFQIRSQIIWTKSHFAIGRGHYHWQHEPCWYAVRQGKTAHWGGDRKQTTVWTIDKLPKSETGHSTQKPVECMQRPIENNSSPGQAVYDPFVGSGTTIIAAEMTGRCAYAMEISPAHVDVCVHRFQNFSGLQAVHEETGLGMAEIAASREVTLPPTVPLQVVKAKPAKPARAPKAAA